MSEKNYILELSEGRCDDPKARIFKAALEEFGLRSLAGARTREIAAKANVNHAAISYYFGGKNELYMELARQIRDFIKYMNEPYFNRFADVLKSEDPFEARKLTLDFFAHKTLLKKSSGLHFALHNSHNNARGTVPNAGFRDIYRRIPRGA